ncbi:MAG: flagellar basal body P-ring formation protein FlgA [Phycisphaerae bacterium]|nr:MAG: flagella basal body P-ring formation protein FlgA [Planctomycetota bacterium]KAB2946709.1 MAG: flagellar basal body P-ring formation protein FlgA [Phycisphaerae bacterium]MBE7455618.1 flagellar basal body P-ring formation protein FlgA [Planctomycetia bacterium]MCK6463255.1 flagellar basal body P-ring formation chaperone FlgA [Phycisphaerae bacterium]MCL4716875.1 flagellar basal body P-ring formation protein FlgA [Phycisphaerae bacterium]
MSYASTRKRHRALSVIARTTVVLAVAAPTFAEEVRVYASAVVTDEVIRVRDVASGDLGAEPLSVVITEAPAPGEQRRVDANMIRTCLRDHGVNLARIRLRGSSVCLVSRPVALRQEAPNVFPQRLSGETPTSVDGESEADSQSLRAFLEAAATQELARYGGRAEVSFEADSQAFLDLTSPPMTFKLARRTGAVPGLATFEVEVSQDGRVLQTVAVKATVTMVREAVVASRPIVKGTIVLPEDVRVESITARSVQQAVAGDPVLVVGRRAERFFAEGEPLDPQQLSAVPIVSRQQVVRVVAVVGGVRLESVGWALDEAAGGQLVRVKLADRPDEPLSGVATAPGVVTVGEAPAAVAAVDGNAAGRPQARPAILKEGA